MNRFGSVLLASLPVLGCASTETGGIALPSIASIGAGSESEVATALSPLRFSGTILILTGAALLFVSRGARGWIPIALGVGLTILLATIASLLNSETFVFLLIATLATVAVIAVFNFKEIRTWTSSLKCSRSRADTSSPSPSEHGSDDRSSNSSRAESSGSDG